MVAWGMVGECSNGDVTTVYLLKRYCTPVTTSYFMKFNFLSETSPKNITFKKNTGQNQIKIQSYASFCILYVTLSLTNFQNFHKFHV